MTNVESYSEEMILIFATFHKIFVFQNNKNTIDLTPSGQLPQYIKNEMIYLFMKLTKMPRATAEEYVLFVSM